MKRNFLLGAACLFSVLVFESCFGEGMYRSDADTKSVEISEEYDSYKDACAAGNYEAAHLFLDEYCNTYLKKISKGYIYRDEKTAAESKYYMAFDHIYNSELQYLMSQMSEEECKDKIVFLLNSVPVVGEVVPGGICDYDYVSDWEAEGDLLRAYITWTKHYNRLCNTILTLAINRKYKSVAQTALMQYVDNVEVTKGGDGVYVDGVRVDGNHGYVKHTSADRDAAMKKYKDALKLGMFD